MSRSFWLRTVAASCALALIAAACGSSGSSHAKAAEDNGGSAAKRSGLLWDHGPCDTARAPYPVGMITVFESPVLSLKDQATAMEASVKAFNNRGGVEGHCMKLTNCDGAADPNKEADCARQFVAKGIVATLNDQIVSNYQGVIDVMTPAGLPRVDISPGFQDLNSPIAYPIGAGGVGTTFMMVPPLTRAGIKKIAAIHIDTATMPLLFGVLKPMLDAYGANIVAKIPVPAGTTDFQQFVLAAEKSGAEGVILPLGNNEALQVLQAAKQLGSKLKFSVSLGTFGLDDVKKFGDFANQMYFNGEVPPVTADQKRWPILADAIADLQASGDPKLQRDQIKSSPLRSWLAVYSFVKVIQDFGKPDDVSRQAISAAFNAAKDVDHFGLIPPWTPSRSAGGPGPYSRVSNPWYYNVGFDAAAGNFVIKDKMLNVLDELAGKIDYAQP